MNSFEIMNTHTILKNIYQMKKNQTLHNFESNYKLKKDSVKNTLLCSSIHSFKKELTNDFKVVYNNIELIKKLKEENELLFKKYKVRDLERMADIFIKIGQDDQIKNMDESKIIELAKSL